MLAVVVGAAVFAYGRVRADLDETINDGLYTRADAVARQARRSQAHLVPSGLPPSEEEAITQLVARDGRVLDTTGTTSVPVLSPSQLRRAGGRAVLVERRVPEIDGPTRVLAAPVSGRPGSPLVAVGQAVDDRDEVLSGLLKGFLIAGPIAVAVASLLGYLLAAAGLAPIEAMRRRARHISLHEHGEPLPLPAAHDEVRRLGETLNEMLDRLRRSFEHERRFVADASHELRTPVAIVKAELEGALHAGGYGPEIRGALVAAVDECDRLGQLAEDLLVLARAADGRLPVRPESLRMRSVLESIRDRFTDRAVERGRRIRVDAPEDLAVGADPLRVRQAIGNLVDNALRHGDGEIVLSARPAGSDVEIEVADQGPGFPPGLADRAFARFSRGDPARTRGGAGLGLSIVRAVAQAHGGRTAIVPGPGATVRVWLPASKIARGDPSPALH